jgi:hypothetical protein
MAPLTGITATRIFNSHIRATDEFTIRLGDATASRSVSTRTGLAPTPSAGLLIGSGLLDMLTADVVGREWDQAGWDVWLAQHFDRIGRNNASALSEAYWTAAEPLRSGLAKLGDGAAKPPFLIWC